MNLKDAVGSIVVRTHGVKIGGGTSPFAQDPWVDLSYCTDPIEVVEVIDDVVYFRRDPDAEVTILSPRYHDDLWRVVAEKYLPAKWRQNNGN